MRIFSSRFLLAVAFIFSSVHFARAADTNVPPRLTIELHDGSRIVGTSLDKSLRFHSALLGDLKLEIKDICSVDCVSSNVTKLTTANGDTFDVSFVDSEFKVKTSFGKVELPVDSVSKLTISTTDSGSYPAGLVGFWSGNNQGRDSVSGADAVLTDITFTDGIDGQAFSFNGVTSSIKIPGSPALEVGTGDGFTIMAWIKPMDVQGLHPLFAWLRDSAWNDNVIQLWIGLRPDENGVLRGFLPGGNENPFIVSQQGVLTPGVFQHIAWTYDKASGMSVLYVNGVVVAQRQMAPQIPAMTEQDLWVSYHDDRPGNWSTDRMFSGLMDDITVYNRALSASEIQATCTKESHGECLTLPTSSTGWWDLMQ
jgi:Concanavalin A-like lectin/glucanases superfamily